MLYLWRNGNIVLYRRNFIKIPASDKFNLYFVICIQGVKGALCQKVYLFNKLINKLQNGRANKWGG